MLLHLEKVNGIIIAIKLKTLRKAMESLSNSNFLKVIDVKKNNDNNTKDKNLIVNKILLLQVKLKILKTNLTIFLSNDRLRRVYCFRKTKKQDS